MVWGRASVLDNVTQGGGLADARTSEHNERSSLSSVSGGKHLQAGSGPLQIQESVGIQHECRITIRLFRQHTHPTARSQAQLNPRFSVRTHALPHAQQLPQLRRLAGVGSRLYAVVDVDLAHPFRQRHRMDPEIRWIPKSAAI
ncbi:hypothetical protein [Nocardia noduli]|uniref:hypothetical protein n=1 Tax=Nocardia noduli TaxID=2815722 RepID=UPI001C2414EF|nr:hypothetical protein [Nocardia noduli]